nr:reverse transcriptase domain-containing protein [Tanacetum cinerariifolium]
MGDQEKVDSVNDGTDIEAEVRCREEANTANSSSSPVRLSNSENSINALTGELKIQKGDQEKANLVNDSTDVEVRGRGEANSTDNSSTSPIQLLISENLINDIKDEPDTQKEGQDKSNLVLESNDFELTGQEEVNSTDHNRLSPVRLSNSEKVDSVNDGTDIEAEIQKGDQEKANLVNDSTDVEVRGRGEANSTDNSSTSPIRLLISENLINDIKDEPDTQKEGQDKSNLVLESNDFELTGQEEGEGDTQKKDQEKVNSVSDSTDVELRGREEASTDHISFSSVPLSDSEN